MGKENLVLYMTLNNRFAQFREANFSLVDRWVFQDKKEILDVEPNSVRAIQVARDLDRLNQWFLYPELVKRLSKKIDLISGKGKLRIIDVCTGYGGLSRYLIGWAEKKGLSLEILGVDSSSAIIREAQLNSDIPFTVADASRLPFQNGQFDIALNVYALHHCDAQTVVDMLVESARVAEAFLFYDLRRTVYGFITAQLDRLLFSDDFVHDAVASHRRAYSIKEIQFLVKEAGVNAAVTRFNHGVIIESQP